MTLVELLFEVDFRDASSKGFLEFHNKYKKQKTDRDLFVQFTSYNASHEERNPYSSPNHSDPVGVYAYPLNYVINNPADIWYGSQTKWIRVLRRKTDKVLYVNLLNTSEIKNDLWNLGYSGSEALKQAAKKFPQVVKGQNKDQKAFFAFLQYDFEKDRFRTGLEQTALLRKTWL